MRRSHPLECARSKGIVYDIIYGVLRRDPDPPGYFGHGRRIRRRNEGQTSGRGLAMTNLRPLTAPKRRTLALTLGRLGLMGSHCRVHPPQLGLGEGGHCFASASLHPWLEPCRQDGATGANLIPRSDPSLVWPAFSIPPQPLFPGTDTHLVDCVNFQVSLFPPLTYCFCCNHTKQSAIAIVSLHAPYTP